MNQFSSSKLSKEVNVLMLDLNRGLNSALICEQCRSIAQIPFLFKKYPIPSIMNTVMVKITELFRDGTNFLRLCILRSMRHCRMYLQEQTLSDVITKNLMPLTTSNDPVSRALVIRFFGTLCQLLEGFTNVHHMILTHLIPQYEVQFDAAVWSAHAYASISKSFATSLCPIYCRFLNDSSNSPKMKLKLIPLGKCMHHSVELATETKHCLKTLLESHLTYEFQLCILDTLSALELQMPIAVDDHISCILKCIKETSKPYVRQLLYKNLQTLAVNVPNHWHENHLNFLNELFEDINHFQCDDIVSIMEIFCILFARGYLQDVLGESQSSTLKCIIKAVLVQDYSKNTSNLAIVGLKTLCTFICCIDGIKFEENKYAGVSPEKVYTIIVTSLFGINRWYLNDEIGPDLKMMKETFDSVVKFFVKYPHFFDLLSFDQMVKIGDSASSERVEILHRFVIKFMSLMPEASMKDKTDPAILAIIEQLSSFCTSAEKTYPKVQGKIMTTIILLFQLQPKLTFLPKDVCGIVFSSFTHSIGKEVETGAYDVWAFYRLARNASCYGQHEIAAALYKNLLNAVVTPNYVSWLTGLMEISEAFVYIMTRFKNNQSLIEKETFSASTFDCFLEALEFSIKNTYSSSNELKCVGKNRWFACAYAKIIYSIFEMLKKCLQLSKTHIGYSKSNMWPYSSKVIEQSYTSVFNASQSVIEDIEYLYACCIDADIESLENLKSLLSWSKNMVSKIMSYKERLLAIETSLVQNFSVVVDSISRDVFEEIKSLVGDPLYNRLPRFLFRYPQTTIVQVILNPKPLKANDPLHCNSETTYMFQIMGFVKQTVLQHNENELDENTENNSALLIRPVKSINVSLHISELMPAGTSSSIANSVGLSSHKTLKWKSANGGFDERRVNQVPIRGEYFHTDFCVHFPKRATNEGNTILSRNGQVSTMYKIIASIMLLDHRGVEWKCSTETSSDDVLALVESPI